MTSAVSTRRDSLLRHAWRLETPAGLVVMFAAALLLRMLIAPHAGFFGDLRLFQQWAVRLADVGPGDFYVEGKFADYPPGYLYVLWVTGKLVSTPGYLALKLPAIVADLGIAWIAGLFAARIAPTSFCERLPLRALVAGCVLFNPALIALSAVWGQVDSVPSFFVLSALLLLFTGRASLQREVAAFLLYAVAIAMKPQTGFVLPVMLYALARRYFIHGPRSEWLRAALSISVAGVLSLALWAVSGLAFGLGPVSLVRFYRDSASVYPVTSANAFNLWGAVGFWRNDSIGGDVMHVLGVSALHFGTLAFVAGVAFALWRAHRALERGAHEGRVLAVTAAAVSLLAYALLTRMHERYMFLSLACLSPLVFVRQLRLALAGLSALFLLNLWYPYSYFNAGWRDAGWPVETWRFEPWFGWLLGGFETDTWQKRFWSLAVVAIAFAVLWLGAEWADRASVGPFFAVPAMATGYRGTGFVPGTHPAPRSEGAASDRESPSPGARYVPGMDPVPGGPEPRASRRAPLVLVGLACAFCLVVLRAQTTPADNLNDSAFHLQMVRWAADQIDDGRVPLDGWYPWLSLGSSHFHHYQSLPHTATAIVARATGAATQTAYLWIQYLLLALWPIAVYGGARLLGWDRWTGAAAAAISPLVVSTPGYGYEHASYTWGGRGVYSQLWAMWLLPLSWGLTWRAVSSGRFYAAAAAASALTIACHFITAYLALFAIGVWVLVLWGGWRKHIGRAALVAGGSLLVASWVLVPLVGDAKWTTQSAYYQATIFNDSYGAGQVLGWLLGGDLFDAGRFPTLTMLLFAGLIVCVTRARTDVRARALLGVFVVGLLLFFGRPTLGPLLDLVPGFGDVQIHRFIMGVQLAGILIGGVALGWVLRVGADAAQRASPRQWAAAAGAGAAVLLAVVLLAPAWTEQGRADSRDEDFIRSQRASDATDGRDLDRLVAIVKARGDGRVYSGLRGNWGADYAVGYVPVFAALANRDVDAIGFTFRTLASLSNDVEAAFDETNPSQYEMFNVRYLILPADREPPIRAQQVAIAGRHRLWEVPTTGYLQVVDRAPAISADRTDVQAASNDFRSSQLASRGVYPGVAFAGGAAPWPTYSSASPPSGSPGRVVSQSHRLEDGVFDATVDASRPAVALLKSTYDRRWRVTVDGIETKPVMMAPSLVGVDVPAGTHRVQFHYEPYGTYPLLLTLGASTLLALVLVPRREELRRRLAAYRKRGRATEPRR